MDYCHRRGVVVRDLKLENTLVHKTPLNLIIKICDFGLSKALGGLASEPKTRCGTVSGMRLVSQQSDRQQSAPRTLSGASGCRTVLVWGIGATAGRGEPCGAIRYQRPNPRHRRRKGNDVQ